MRGHGNQRIAGCLKRLPKVIRHLQTVGKFGVRQIALIAARKPHGIELDGVAPPQLGGMAFTRQLNGERRAPGTGADDRHRFYASVLHPLALLKIDQVRLDRS